MLQVGATETGHTLTLPDRIREAHIHVIGQTRSGKSKLLEHMIRQDIARGRGLCLIDPHGFLSDAIERWCCARGMGHIRRIHLVKPGDPTWTAGFNPLRLSGGEAPSVRVDIMAAACAQVWGGQDLNQTPRLKRILRATFFALSVNGLTLAEAPFLLSSGDPDGTRRALTASLPDPAYQFIWRELNALSRREFAEVTESTVSRVAAFLDAPSVRLMVGQRTSALDFRQAMDRGDIVLVNLGSRDAFSYENARVMGALIINDLFLSALGRDEATAKRRAFSLYMDEAYDYLSRDIERILDQTAKFGLHAVVAHQRLGQLRERGVYDAVMGSTRTKIAFSLADEDAGVMAGELFRDQLDPERPKHVLDKPVVVGQRRELFRAGSRSRSGSQSEGEAASEAESETEGVSESVTDLTSTSAGEGFRTEDGAPPEQVSSFETAGTTAGSVRGTSRGTTTSRSSTTSTSRSHGWSETESWHEAMVDERAWLPTATYSLEEQLHLAQVRLRELPQATAVVKPMGGQAVVVRVPHVGPVLSSPRLIARFREAVSAKSPYVTTTEAAIRELDDRQRALLQAPAPETGEGDASFWTSE